MRLPIWIFSLLVVTLLPFSTGCEQDYVVDFKSLQTSLAAGQKPPAKTFWSDITFCERVSKKSGKRIRQGDSFVAGEKSYVYGLVDLQNLPLEQTHSIHLVWLRPDSHEIFRRYAEVQTVSTPEGFRTQIVWLKAEDFGYRKEEVQTSDESVVTLSSRLNTSLTRQRGPGSYTLRVYLNRELLTEAKFNLSKFG